MVLHNSDFYIISVNPSCNAKTGKLEYILDIWKQKPPENYRELSSDEKIAWYNKNTIEVKISKKDYEEIKQLIDSKS